MNMENKVQTTKIKQSLKAVDVACKDYMKDRNEPMKDLVVETIMQLTSLIEADWKDIQQAASKPEINSTKFISELKQ